MLDIFKLKLNLDRNASRKPLILTTIESVGIINTNVVKVGSQTMTEKL